MQTRTRSLMEALTNQGVGICYAVLLYSVGFGFTIAEGLATTAVFALLGAVRAFSIRRLYDWWDRRSGN